MAALCNIHAQVQKPPLHLSIPSHSSSKPLVPSPLFLQITPSSICRTSLRARASLHHRLLPNPLPSPHKTPQNFNSSHFPKPLSYLLKSISLSIATVALLLSRFPTKPSYAVSPGPPSTISDTLREEEENENEKEKENENEREKERTFEEYLESHPDDVECLKALMGTKFNLGKIPEAIDVVDRLILLQPTNREWPLLRAQLHLHGGDAETAKSEFEDIIAADPFDVNAYHGLAMAIAQLEPGELDSLIKRIEDVMEHCKKAKKKEELRNFKLLVAQLRMVEGKYEDALKLQQELVKEEPRDFRPYLCQVILYTLIGRKEDAAKQFRKYRRLVPKGHPYSRYFDEIVLARKGFSQMAEKEQASLRR